MNQLLERYREAHRHYHTSQHLEECFEKFDELHHLAERPGEVALALWFHDAIYDPRRHDNEERSARWAKEVVCAFSPQAGERVHDLVLVTRHDAAAGAVDAKIVVDVDLSILGAPRPRFDEYDAQVRREYARVPQLLYRRKRRQVLESFLARPAIFQTDEFRNRYEARARANLTEALARL